MASNAPKKCRKFLGVLYPDAQNYDFDAVLDLFDSIFEEWAYIVHDKDTDENGELLKPHVHWVGSKRTPSLISTVSNQLGVPENAIEFCKSWKTSIRYLVHDDNNDKYHYSDEDIVSNFSVSEYLGSKGLLAQVGAITDQIMSRKCTTIVQLHLWAYRSGNWQAFRANIVLWNQLLAALNHERYYE